MGLSEGGGGGWAGGTTAARHSQAAYEHAELMTSADGQRVLVCARVDDTHSTLLLAAATVHDAAAAPAQLHRLRRCVRSFHATC